MAFLSILDSLTNEISIVICKDSNYSDFPVHNQLLNVKWNSSFPDIFGIAFYGSMYHFDTAIRLLC